MLHGDDTAMRVMVLIQPSWNGMMSAHGRQFGFVALCKMHSMRPQAISGEEGKNTKHGDNHTPHDK